LSQPKLEEKKYFFATLVSALSFQNKIFTFAIAHWNKGDSPC